MPTKKTRWGNYHLDVQVGLGTLAANTVVSVDATPALTEALHAIKIQHGVAYLNGLTSGEGPILFGLSTDSLTDAQIAEALRVNPDNSGHDDQVALATRLRKIRVLGVLGAHPAGVGERSFLDLRDQKIDIGLADTDAFRVWAYNPAGSALTTGASVNIDALVLGRWLD